MHTQLSVIAVRSDFGVRVFFQSPVVHLALLFFQSGIDVSVDSARSLRIIEAFGVRTGVIILGPGPLSCAVLHIIYEYGFRSEHTTAIVRAL